MSHAMPDELGAWLHAIAVAADPSLTLHQLDVLLTAYASGIAPAVKDLHTLLGYPKYQISRAVARLERLRLVRCCTRQSDRRVVVIGTTDDGRAYVAAIAASIGRLGTRMGAA